MFLRRLGQNGRQLCQSGLNCPQILEMVDGSFAVAGEDITDTARAALPPGPGIGPTERMVKVPRQVMAAARSELPSAA